MGLRHHSNLMQTLVLGLACGVLLTIGCTGSSSPATIVLGEQVTADDPTSGETPSDDTSTSTTQPGGNTSDPTSGSFAIDNITVTGSLTQGQSSQIAVSCTVSDPDATAQAVAVDFSSLGGPAAVRLKASGKVWTWSGIVTATVVGSGLITFVAVDERSAVTTQTTSVVVAPASQDLPAVANQKPRLTNVTVTGDLVVGLSCNVTVSCGATDPDGTVQSVTADLSQIGGSASQPLTSSGGWYGDGTSYGGGQWTWSGILTPRLSGTKAINLTAVDNRSATNTATAAATISQGQEALPVAKKLIQYGWDRPDPYTLNDYLKSMAGLPFDGVILALRNYRLGFDPNAWSPSELANQAELLSNASMGSLTDNFIVINLYSSNEVGRGMDWFNDNQWQVIASNMRILSDVASQWNSAGVCLDFEPYGSNPWRYASGGTQPSHTFPQMVAQVRLRGQQFMDALQSRSPKLRVFTLFMLSGLQSLYDHGTPQLDKDLPKHQYALLPAFLNGMLDRLGPESIMIDGNETAYYYSKSDDFLNAASYIHERALDLVDPANLNKYLAQVQVGSSIYLDYIMGPGPFTGHPYLSRFLATQDQLLWLSYNVYWAARTSDEYTWCYGENFQWKTAPTASLAAEAIASARDALRPDHAPPFDAKPMLAAALQQWQQMIDQDYFIRSTSIVKISSSQIPVIDGNLNDAAWQTAPLDMFQARASTLKGAPDAGTRAWATYDSKGLNIAFWCEEPKIAQLRAQNPPAGDSVQVFISTGSDAVPYKTFTVMPFMQQAWDDDGLASQIKWRWAMRTDTASWSIEIRLPWSILGGMPAANATRQVNLCRIRSITEDYSSWSAIVNWFTEPWRFGQWRFLP